MSEVISVRISDDYRTMLDAIADKGRLRDDAMIPVKDADIVRVAIKEYYARIVDSSLENSYMSLVSSTLENVLSPHFRSQRKDIEALYARLHKEAALYDRWMKLAFELIFRSGRLQDDPDQIRQMLADDTCYDDVLTQLAKEEK